MKTFATSTLVFMALALPAMAEVTCKTADNVTNCESEGNLAPTQDLGCISLGETTATMTPPDLALSVMACQAKGRKRDMTELFTLMMMRGYFDATRVTDKTAHQALTVLRIELGQRLGPTVDAELTADLKSLIGDKDSDEFKGFCQRFTALPLPDYVPDYMIEHGLNAVLGQTEIPPLREIDGAKEWQAIIDQGLNCPKSAP